MNQDRTQWIAYNAIRTESALKEKSSRARIACVPVYAGIVAALF